LRRAGRNSSYKKFTNNDALYSASLREFQRHHWDNAISRFEKLTTDLPARDFLLPRSVLVPRVVATRTRASICSPRKAGAAWSRLSRTTRSRTMPALESARSYGRMWRKPQLDPTYGETSLASYNTLIGLYPSSNLVPIAQKEIASWRTSSQSRIRHRQYLLPAKGVRFGDHLLQDVLTKYANSPTARDAAIKLVDAYRRSGTARTRASCAPSCGSGFLAMPT
jgi:outer membrane protein assembly factor BamD (BamD/ComL family)